MNSAGRTRSNPPQSHAEKTKLPGQNNPGINLVGIQTVGEEIKQRTKKATHYVYNKQRTIFNHSDANVKVPRTCISSNGHQGATPLVV